MTAKRTVIRQSAEWDLERITEFYITESGGAVAARFLDAVARSVQDVSHNPEIGSRRFADLLRMPRLRTWPVAGFPYLIIYVEADDEIAVVKVVHHRRDIPSVLIER
ncbi:MAG: type II toxin-antitoxin system RelE/ParE family toxin [Alphaproteobacteria bacterium]